MFFKKYGDIVVSVFYIILSVAIIIMAKMLPKSAVMDIGPDFMPLVIGGLTLVLAIWLLALSIKNFKHNAAEAETAGAEDCDYKRVISSFVIILAYVMILKPIGFIISTILYLPVQMYILSPADKKDKKNIALLALVTVIFTMVVFFLFRYGFKIMLPSGIFTINL